MNKRAERLNAAKRRVIQVGGTYRDTSHGVVVTVEDHEIRGGKRTGRLVVLGADGMERFPRRWYCREQDLVALPPVPDTSRRGAVP